MSQKFPLLFSLHGIKQDVSVSIVTILLDGQQNNHRSNPGSIKRFYSSPKHPDHHWSPPSLVFSGCKVLLLELNLIGYERDHSQSSGEVKNTWSYVSTPTILHSVHRESFSFFANYSNSLWNCLFNMSMHIDIVSSNTCRYFLVSLMYAQLCKVSDDRLWGVRIVSKTLRVYLV